MKKTLTRKTAKSTNAKTPDIAHLDKWIGLADSLIAKGFGKTMWSGKTLAKWKAVLVSSKNDRLAKMFATAAVGGLFAAYIREAFGSPADELYIGVNFEARRIS